MSKEGTVHISKRLRYAFRSRLGVELRRDHVADALPVPESFGAASFA